MYTSSTVFSVRQ